MHIDVRGKNKNKNKHHLFHAIWYNDTSCNIFLHSFFISHITSTKKILWSENDDDDHDDDHDDDGDDDNDDGNDNDNNDNVMIMTIMMMMIMMEMKMMYDDIDDVGNYDDEIKQ